MPSFRKATRDAVRLRALLEGLSGSGKSLTSLIIANAIVKEFGGRIGVIDSQGGQMNAYAEAPLPSGDLADFDIIELASGNPDGYISAINEFEATKEHRVIIVDSLTQAWTGKDGILEKKDKAEGKGPQPWAAVAPLMNRFIERLTTCKPHLIATVRVKTDTVWEKNSDGKIEGHRVGLKTVQKEGLEYEFDLWASMDEHHTLRVHNARGCTALDGAMLHKPNDELTRPIIEWLKTGKTTEAEPVKRLATKAMVDELVRRVTERFGTSRTNQEQAFWSKWGYEMHNAPYEQIEEALRKVQTGAK